MPECAIGLFPDVGATAFLSRLPGATGAYMGTTGARLSGGWGGMGAPAIHNMCTLHAGSTA